MSSEQFKTIKKYCDNQEGLKMESSRQKETWKAKNDPEKTFEEDLKKKKNFEGDLKKMELTWGTADREAKERSSWRKRSSCIILNG